MSCGLCACHRHASLWPAAFIKNVGHTPQRAIGSHENIIAIDVFADTLVARCIDNFAPCGQSLHKPIGHSPGRILGVLLCGIKRGFDVGDNILDLPTLRGNPGIRQHIGCTIGEKPAKRLLVTGQHLCQRLRVARVLGDERLLRPAREVEVRIVDDEGRDVPRGSPGELLFRHASGAPFVVEYFGNPEASAKKCAGGWLHMGDVVHEDADGWLYFDYRKGGGIRRNGDFIDPAYIEKVIAEDPSVDDVYVYGIPAKNGGVGEKDVVAAVVAKSGMSPGFDVQALFALCRRPLEANFIPRFIQVLDAIPKTASEKPQDRFLIESLNRHPESVFTEVR